MSNLVPMASRQEMTDRERALAAYGSRYLRVEGVECVYCGRKGAVHDHVPPLALASFALAGSPHILYPACNWCNETLGPHPAVCLKDRARFVQKMREMDFAQWQMDLERFAHFQTASRIDQVRAAAGPVSARIAARLAAGVTATLCRCEKCRPATPSPRPSGLG